MSLIDSINPNDWSFEMDYEKMFFKTVTDPEFRKKLQENPRQALESTGMQPTDEQVDAISKFDWNHVKDIQNAFGGVAIGT